MFRSYPRFSPDGKYLAFIAARTDGKPEEADNPKVTSQVWLLNRAGGEAQRLTEMSGGASGFEWSPDSTRLVIVSYDPEDKPEKEADKDGMATVTTFGQIPPEIYRLADPDRLGIGGWSE